MALSPEVHPLEKASENPRVNPIKIQGVLFNDSEFFKQALMLGCTSSIRLRSDAFHIMPA
jgi:hypothetical protein